jgi:hypothetical protein
MPLVFMGGSFASDFWRSSWPLALILLIALIGLNSFYLTNRRLFLLLEREDWPALVDYLEQKVISRGHYSPRLVQLLANSYLVMSDSAGVINLENKAALAKPALVEANALVFGAAHILSGDIMGAANFFKTRLEKGKSKEMQWVRWYYGFSLLLGSEFAKAEAEFKALAASSEDGIITGLSAYFLSETLLKYSENQDECRALVEEGRGRVKETLKGIGGWNKEAVRVETEVHAAIIRQYIDKAGIWLFGSV